MPAPKNKFGLGKGGGASGGGDQAVSPRLPGGKIAGKGGKLWNRLQAKHEAREHDSSRGSSLEYKETERAGADGPGEAVLPVKKRAAPSPAPVSAKKRPAVEDAASGGGSSSSPLAKKRAVAAAADTTPSLPLSSTEARASKQKLPMPAAGPSKPAPLEGGLLAAVAAAKSLAAEKPTAAAVPAAKKATAALAPPLARLRSMFHKPADAAAKELGLSAPALLAACRTYKIETWPYEQRQRLLARKKEKARAKAKAKASGGGDMFVSAPVKSAAQIKAEAEAAQARKLEQAKKATEAAERQAERAREAERLKAEAAEAAEAARRKRQEEKAERKAERAREEKAARARTPKARPAATSAGGATGADFGEESAQETSEDEEEEDEELELGEEEEDEEIDESPYDASDEEKANGEKEYARLKQEFADRFAGRDVPERDQLSKRDVSDILTNQELQDFVGLRAKRSKAQLMHILWGLFALAKPTPIPVQTAAPERKKTIKKKQTQKKQKRSGSGKSSAAVKPRVDSGDSSDSDGDIGDVKAMMASGRPGSDEDGSSSEEEPAKQPEEEPILDLNDPDVIRMLQGGLRVRKRVSYRTDD